jgi:hypothetical protein
VEQLHGKYGGSSPADHQRGDRPDRRLPTWSCTSAVTTGEKYEFSRQTAPTGNNAVTDFTVEVPPGVMFVNVDFTGNTAQAVTVEAQIEELTTI